VTSRATAKAKPTAKVKASGRVKPARGPASSPSSASSLRIRPLHDRILVKRMEEGEQKVGGIIVPDSAKEKPTHANVMAVGSGRVMKDGKKVPLSVKAGDKVLIGKWSGTEVKIDGQEYLILKEDEVLGILS
jgi:chaperonin GroES